MKIIKKLLLSGSFFLPLINFSCSTKEPQLIIKKPLVDDDTKDKKTENKLPIVITIEQPPVFIDKISDVNGKKNEQKKPDKSINNTQDTKKKPSHEHWPFYDTIDEKAAHAEVNQIYSIINKKHKKFTKKAIFAPREWVNQSNFTIKKEYMQKDQDVFNKTFFNKNPHFESNLKWIKKDFIKITTNEEFDKYIINRFKELNKFHNFNQDVQIKKLFEELYLDNQDVYVILKESDIFIDSSNYHEDSPDDRSIIVTYENTIATLNIIFPFDSLAPGVTHQYYEPDPSFRVFLVKKNYNLNWNIITPKESERPTSFRDRLKKWYDIEFKKHLP